MDVYNKIISDNTLYTPDIIERIAKNDHKWIRSSWRERELLLLHITTCMLLCNEEKRIGNPLKRKIEETGKDDKEGGMTKRSRPNIYDPTRPGTSKDYYGGTSTEEGSSGTISSAEDTIMLEDRIQEDMDREDYRFSLLNYLPNKLSTQVNVLKSWKIQSQLTHQWDAVDNDQKKLVMVSVDRNKAKEKKRYLHMKAEISENCCLCSIDVDNTSISWVDNDRPAKGEHKKNISGT